MQKLQHVIDSVQGTSGSLQIKSFYSDFPELVSQKLSSEPSKLPNVEPQGGHSCSPATASNSGSSSFSQSSSSSHSCSSGTLQHSAVTVPTKEDIIVMENPADDVCKRVKSDAELHLRSQELKPLIRSESERCLREQPVSNGVASLKKRAEDEEKDGWRVKVTCGEEKIRLRMPRKWKYKELVGEIGRRFNIDEVARFHIKYLDDDNEWVLLTCDADLEECIDIYEASQVQTIRLSLQVSHHVTDRSDARGSRSGS